MFYVGHLDGMGETRRASIHCVKKQHWRDRKGAEASTNRAGIVVSGGGEHTLDALIHHVGIAVKGLQSRHRDRVQRKHSPLPTINSDARPDHTWDRSPLGDYMTLGDYMQALIDDHHVCAASTDRDGAVAISCSARCDVAEYEVRPVAWRLTSACVS